MFKSETSDYFKKICSNIASYVVPSEIIKANFQTFCFIIWFWGHQPYIEESEAKLRRVD